MKKSSNIDDLRLDNLGEVFSYLGIAELLRQRSVSKDWKKSIDYFLRKLQDAPWGRPLLRAALKENPTLRLKDIYEIGQILEAIYRQAFPNANWKVPKIKPSKKFFYTFN